ncbi:hypothetical protein R1sor_023443 [Riccia sorocarpa]|uniref:Haem-binding uptake Tiki superfamily ChaN domain-containing protein n=1 Tax=Riccia sorocarpa TaxID=122646 RepID=A0ABD3GPS6_9MARC
MGSYSAVGNLALSSFIGNSPEVKLGVPGAREFPQRSKVLLAASLRRKNRRLMHQVGCVTSFLGTPLYRSSVSKKRWASLQIVNAQNHSPSNSNSPSGIQLREFTNRVHTSLRKRGSLASPRYSGKESRNFFANENCENAAETEEIAEEGEISSEETSSKFSGTEAPGISRRMLLGAVGLGLTFSSSRKAAAVDTGTNFPFTKGSWFLGEADMEPSGTAEKKKGSRIYDATVLGEPVALSGDKDRVWQKLLAARVVYLGEVEMVADLDDQLLELEIIRTARDKCFAQARGVTVALEAFPIVLQPQLNLYMNKKITDEKLRALVPALPEDRWQGYLPILQYCRDNGVRIVGMGPPMKVVDTVRAKGIQALDKADMQKFVPPLGKGYKFKSFPKTDDSKGFDLLPNASGLFGPGPYRYAQARLVADYSMSQVIAQLIKDGGAVGLTIVITGASHVKYGTRGMGLPAWTSKNIQKRTQAVILLNPEKQHIRKEGDLPEADFLWYSAGKVCTRNCFDRVEVARVIGAAGRRRDTLPEDIQLGLERGLVDPEVLENFFKLDEQPILADLTSRFQGLRERWLADPRFLQRLAIEETISITTTLFAQYERRGDRFWKEIDYVTTDSLRGAVVDFFTVWLPAPRLSFRALDPRNEDFNTLESLKGLLGSFPDNAFQRAQAGVSWGVSERIGAIVVGGLKLFGVGFISCLGTVAATNFVLNVRQRLSSDKAPKPQNKRSPILKTALVYGTFLGTSANLRYQVIAGVVEHWLADYWLASQPLAGSVVSFLARTANSYFGTGQWVDLARFAGLQAHNDEDAAPEGNGNGVVKEQDLTSQKPVNHSEGEPEVENGSNGKILSTNGHATVEEAQEAVKEAVKPPKP